MTYLTNIWEKMEIMAGKGANQQLSSKLFAVCHVARIKLSKHNFTDYCPIVNEGFFFRLCK